MAFYHHKQIAKLEVSPMEKAVLRTLADYADVNGKCWPGQSTIAKAACVGLRTVQRAVASLIEQKLIRVTYTQTTNKYVLTLPKCPIDASDMPEGHVQPATQAAKYISESINEKTSKSLADAKAEIVITEKCLRGTTPDNTIDIIITDIKLENAPIPGKKIGPADLETLWKETLPKHFPSIVLIKKFTQQELGMLKHFITAVAPHSSYAILEEVLNDWCGYGHYVSKMQGSKGFPYYPKIPYILKYCQDAANFHLEYKPQQAKMLEANAKKKEAAKLEAEKQAAINKKEHEEYLKWKELPENQLVTLEYILAMEKEELGL